MGEFTEALRQRVLDWLSVNVPESRLQHVVRVEEMAIALAQHHQVDTTLAAQAALMHDLAKYFKPQRLLAMAKADGLAIDPVEELNPHLLHAEVGAIVARDEFGVDHPDVLAAIADHTLGRPGMSPISCIVFLADSLEPGRGDAPELITLRQASQESLPKAVWMSADCTLNHLISRQRLIHPRVLLTRNWFMREDTRTTQRRSPNRPSSPPIKQPRSA
ncbi:MAG TPA: bis(5'-nucleosyl)-tetraphosphatase (symmetrical) YqeK [Chroococcidiopsis sp.]